MWYTAALFILGGWGLAGAPPFATLLGEHFISHSAEAVHQHWLVYIFIFAEVLTSAAVLRIAFRIFFGWGQPAPSDKSSSIEEKPETEHSHQRTPAAMFVPAAALIMLGIVLTFLPQIQSRATESAYEFTNQSVYAASVLDNVQITSTQNAQPENLSSSIVHSCIALLLSVLLALSTVFRHKLGRAVNFTRSLELGNSWLRQAHSGHPGDYVAWLSFGTALVGLVFLWWLH